MTYTRAEVEQDAYEDEHGWEVDLTCPACHTDWRSWCFEGEPEEPCCPQCHEDGARV